MPVILSIKEQPPQGMKQKLLAKRYPAKIEVQDTLLQTIPFRLIQVTSRNHKMKWERIAKLAGEHRTQLLCGETIALPEGMERFVPKEYKGILSVNFLMELLRTAQLPPTKLTISLYDPCARYCYVAERLMQYASQVYVVTENFMQYRFIAEEIMQKCGGVLLLTDSFQALNCQIILSPGRLMHPLSGKSGGFLFTSIAPVYSVECMVFESYHVALPSIVRELCPPELTGEYFASALYELCGRKELDKKIPDSCCCGNEIYSLKRMREILTNTV